MALENMEDMGKLFKGKLDDFMSKTKWCPKCHYPIYGDGCETCAQIEKEEAEKKAAEYRKNIRRMGGLKAFEDYTEEKYDSRYYDAKKAISLCAGFPKENLYIYGERGVGKTHLGVINIRKHPQGLLLKPSDILRGVREMALDAKEEKKAIQRLIDHPCLLIDDLGTEKLTEYALSIIYEIIDGRDMGKKSGLIITSNYDLNGLAARMGDDRVASRISGMCRILRITGKDRRAEL